MRHHSPVLLRLDLVIAACLCLCLCLLSACDSGEQEFTGPSYVSGPCTPSCMFKTCGGDGCGGSCPSTCAVDQVCSNFSCVSPGEAGVPEDAVADLPTEPSPSDGDVDGDLIQDEVDNCPALFNPAQQDMDSDYAGDQCDPDTDGDGVLNEQDCNPVDRYIYPGAEERCGNLMDDNCNGAIDEEGATGCVDHFADLDNDGAGASVDLRCLCGPEGEHSVIIGGDCDDSDPSFSPLVAERCDDLDNNCNLLVDEGCDDDADGYCDWDMEIVGNPAACPLGAGDCYDYSDMVHPGVPEIPADGIDNNCDGKQPGGDTDCEGPCTGPTLDAALCALDICGGEVLSTNLSSPTGDNTTGGWDNIQHYGSLTNDLAPYNGISYFVMGSGPVYINGTGGDLGGGSTGADAFDPTDLIYDAIELKLTLQAPVGVTGFSIDYIFMSQEYEEWIGTQFNDKFYVILNAPQTTQGQQQVINFTQCSNPAVYSDFTMDGQSWCYIAINTAFSEPCVAPTTDITGSGFECGAGGSSTGWLTTTWPINPGEVFSLTFHIHDTADEFWDSMVLIDNFTWEGQPVQAGTGAASHN